MPRRMRVVVPDLPHHVTHRGNRRKETFREPEDYEVYLRLLRKYALRYGLRIWAYTLMPNHTHLVVVPSKQESLSDAIQCVDSTYAMLFNALYETSGHLWEGRFFSCVLDEMHLWNAIRYVERNPLRGGLISRAEDYRWSSAAAHCGQRSDPILSNDLPLTQCVENWTAWLAMTNTEDHDRKLRERTESGYPCGSDEFVIGLEQQLGRRIRRLSGGRKPAKEGEEPCGATTVDQLKFRN